jgi:hypothetical protein
VRSETSGRRAPAGARRLTRALLLGACALGAGCQLLVTFETVPEGTGGGGSTSSTTSQGGGGADTTAQGGDTTTTGTEQGGDTTTTGTEQGGSTTTSTETSTAPTCNANADCEDMNPCTVDTCSAGTCSYASVVTGTVIDPGDKNLPSGSGECRDLVCDNGQAVLVPNFLNCADQVPGNCNIRPCESNGVCGLLQLAPAGTPCDTNGDGTFDGACDGIGPDFTNCQPG